MDDQYFRKEKKTSSPTWRKILFKNKPLSISLLVVLIAFSFMMFGNRGILQRLRLEEQKEELQTKIRQAQDEQRQLQQQSKALDSDPKAIEKIAREKYGMIRDGETIYKVKKEK